MAYFLFRIYHDYMLSPFRGLKIEFLGFFHRNAYFLSKTVVFEVFFTKTFIFFSIILHISLFENQRELAQSLRGVFGGGFTEGVSLSCVLKVFQALTEIYAFNRHPSLPQNRTASYGLCKRHVA